MKFSDWWQERQAQQALASTPDLARKALASGAELCSQGSEAGEACGCSADQSISQHDVGGSIQVQLTHELPSQGLNHVDARVQKTKQTATTDELAVDLMPYFLPMLSLQEQQDQEAMLQNQHAHALKTRSGRRS